MVRTENKGQDACWASSAWLLLVRGGWLLSAADHPNSDNGSKRHVKRVLTASQAFGVAHRVKCTAEKLNLAIQYIG